jgi:hypothetical protein
MTRNKESRANEKPWEENWDTDGETIYLRGEDHERVEPFARIYEPQEDGDSWAQDRAELAAAAPEMARQLLDLLTGPMAENPASRTSWSQERFDAMRAVLRRACVLHGEPVLKEKAKEKT